MTLSTRRLFMKMLHVLLDDVADALGFVLLEHNLEGDDISGGMPDMT